MPSLLSKLSGVSKSLPIEPREIFMSLPQKNKRYEYPRDVQTEVWRKWFSERDKKNNIIKMNTGSGKTVVGLMILQSCLNEGKGPAVYVVPDNYLVDQVCKTAQDLGIAATTERDNYQYTENRAILVTNIHALINGRSVFGMRSEGNYPIGSIVIDDVHSCLDTITSQYSMKIPSNHKLYNRIIGLFDSQWKSYNHKSYTDIVENSDPTKIEIIPFWMWQEKQAELYSILSQYNNQDEDNKCVYFNLPLIQDILSTCDCFVSSRGIEIIPEGVSISKIQSFENAQRRIFMSATLSDDSIFVSTIGLDENEVRSIITPDNANDIGDRLILFPRHLNSKISDEQIREAVLSLANNNNIVVIVPSFERARFWDATGNRVVSKENIEKAVTKLKQGHIGLVVLVNRYDGIDLPDDACRILVIDGLPPLKNEKDKYMQSIDPNSKILLREQIQRIEQGMGRGVRSNGDYCCVVLMGDSLSNVLLHNNGTSFFSSATKAQYDLSKDLWNLLLQDTPAPTITEVFDLASFSLNREIEWIKNSKERLSTIRYASSMVLDRKTVALRKAFDYSDQLQWQKAISEIDNAINVEEQRTTKAYLLQIKAKYTNMIDRSKAQQILLSGRSLSKAILAPIDGIVYDKLINNTPQAKGICVFIQNENISQNNFVIYANTLTDSLVFSQNTEAFEQALMKLGEMLGFCSTRPDKETNGEGPDNLWAIGDNTYFVIECKSGATATTISKEYCNQLGGSMRWFEKGYPSSSGIPIMVHPSLMTDRQATAVSNMRVINKSKLEELKKAIGEFVVALAQKDNWLYPTPIESLLAHYKLRGRDIVDHYTLPYKCE